MHSVPDTWKCAEADIRPRKREIENNQPKIKHSMIANCSESYGHPIPNRLYLIRD